MKNKTRKEKIKLKTLEEMINTGETLLLPTFRSNVVSSNLHLINWEDSITDKPDLEKEKE